MTLLADGNSWVVEDEWDEPTDPWAPEPEIIVVIVEDELEALFQPKN